MEEQRILEEQSFPHYPSPNSLEAGILNSNKISEVVLN